MNRGEFIFVCGFRLESKTEYVVNGSTKKLSCAFESRTFEIRNIFIVGALSNRFQRGSACGDDLLMKDEL